MTDVAACHLLYNTKLQGGGCNTAYSNEKTTPSPALQKYNFQRNFQWQSQCQVQFLPFLFENISIGI